MADEKEIQAATTAIPPVLPGEALTPRQVRDLPTSRPWGFWATMGFAFVMAAAFVGAGQAALKVFLVMAPMLGLEVSPEGLGAHGLLWSFSICATAPVLVGLSCLFAWLRRGIPLGEYLGLKRVPRRDLLAWCAGLLVWLVVSDWIAVWLGQPVVPEVMLTVYRTAVVPPLLWLGIVAGAPLSEEVFFRGFLFKGLMHSPIGRCGAVLLTSLIWALIHGQYNWFGIAIIFVTGLLFGCARLSSGSIYPGLLMHALMNFLATLQVMSLVESVGVDG